MSSKGKNVADFKSKGSNPSRKNNRRRSQRHASLSNGDQEETKERAGKRGREANKDSNDYGYDEELYKSVVDLVPSTDYNCSPAENPAIPGTQVNLHGVILHETQGGLIVLNVRWRNQVYSGALIDIEKTKWAAERISTEGNSELSKFNTPIYNNTQPPIKKLRIPTSTLNQHLADDSDSGSSTSVKKKNSTSPTTPSKSNNKSRTNGGGKKRNAGTHEPTSPILEEAHNTPKKTKIKIITNGVKSNESSSTSFECPEPNCGKTYKNKSGLAYHQRHQHTKKIESFEEKETKSDDSDSGEDNFVIDEKAGEESSKEEEEKIESETQPENKLSVTLPETNSIKPETIESEEKMKIETKEDVKDKKLDVKEEATPQTPQVKEEKPIVDQEAKDSGERPVPTSTATTTAMACVKSFEVDKKEPLEPQTALTPKSSIPTIHVVRSSVTTPQLLVNNGSDTKPPVPPSIVVVKSEEERQRSGSSQIIIHSDHENSLNELFPPTQMYHQFSPTLSSLNPQKLNQSMTEALSKHQTGTNTINAVVTSAPLIISRMDNSAPPVTGAQLTKPVLSSKPSVEIKSNNFDLMNSQALFYNPALAAQSNDDLPKIDDIIDGSDDERSVSPENILKSVHHIFPQKERVTEIAEVKVTKPSNIMTSLALTPGAMLGGGIRPTHTQNAFENSLIFRDLASKMSSEAYNLSPHMFSTKMGPVPSLVIDQKMSPQLLRTMNDQKTSSLALLPGMVADDLKNLQGVEEKAKPSLLHQRLAAGNTTTSNKHFPNNKQPNTAAVFSNQGRPNLSGKIETTLVSSIPQEFRYQQEKMLDKLSVTTSLTLTSRVPEKPKSNLTAPTGLRINPLPEERQATVKGWQPYSEAHKDGLPTSSQPYRTPLAKSISMTDMQIFAASMDSAAENRQKMPLKRATPTIPIAPAPSASRPDPTTVSGSIVDSGIDTSGGNRDIFTQRFTLTSDKRLISSPSENRGRPKKIRVEKTERIPIGTVQEVARSRGAPESPAPRSRGTQDNSVGRKVTSPVVRPSVIQGSVHPTVGQPSITDHTSPPKKPELHMFQLSRSMNDHGSPALVDERSRFSQQVKIQNEARNLPGSMNDKYRDKNLKSPTGIYFNQPNPRRILSPPSSRSPAISPRGPMETLPRSPTSAGGGGNGFPHDIAIPGSKPYLPFGGDSRDKYPYPVSGVQAEAHARLHEHLRKQEMHRSPSEAGRPTGPADSRKSVLSPLEGGLGIPPSFSRPHHEYEKELFSRHQSPRGEITPRDIPTRPSIYDHRGVSHDENDQSRITRERYLMASGLPSQQTMYTLRNASSPPAVPNVPSTHSSNLALGRADGSILTKLPSSYEARSTEPKR